MIRRPSARSRWPRRSFARWKRVLEPIRPELVLTLDPRPEHAGSGHGLPAPDYARRPWAMVRPWLSAMPVLTGDGSKIHRAAVPVVSVGNLTLGGTGKTPMVEWLARWYRRRGLRVAILSRGYGQEGGLNDEGQVLEENLPDVPHLQGPDRVALAGIAAYELETELIVLDDGFQHRRLARDLDLVLIDALDPFGLGNLFPRGLLREPIRSLRRASVVVLVAGGSGLFGREGGDQSEGLREAGRLPWVEARHAPLDLIDGEGSRLR